MPCSRIKEELAHVLGNTVQVVAQRGEGLAAGLTSVFRHFTAAWPTAASSHSTATVHISRH